MTENVRNFYYKISLTKYLKIAKKLKIKEIPKSSQKKNLNGCSWGVYM